MVKKILLATDGSKYAADACRFLAALPLPADTEVRVVCVVDLFVESLLETVQPRQRDHMRFLTEVAAEALRRDGLEVTTELRSGDADHQILLAAEEWRADLVVVGSRGLTGLAEFVLGSVASNVAKHAHCPVLVARTARHELHTVVVATDNSIHARKATDFLAELPLPLQTEVNLVHVLRPPNLVIDLAAIGEPCLYDALLEEERKRWKRGKELLNEVAARLGNVGREAMVDLRTGDPAAQILAVVEEKKADLLVLGARGTSLIRELVVGSVADRVLRQAHCSVMFVR